MIVLNIKTQTGQEERERVCVKYNTTDRTKREKVWRVIQEHRHSERRYFVKNQETDRKRE